MNNNNDNENNIPLNLDENTNNRDLSRVAFIRALTSILNGDNVGLLPLSGSNNNLRQILRQSLYDKNNFKKVLSEEGEKQLKVVKFDQDKFETDECMIMRDKFEKDEEIIQLPCSHIFKKEAIETWLKEESAKCPICRFELKCKEVKIELENPVENPTENPVENPTENSVENPTENPTHHQNVDNFIRQMRMIYNPIDFLNIPNRNSLLNQRNIVNRIISQESQFVQDRDLQNAIMASIHDQNINDNDEYIEEEKNFVEDDIEDHPDFILDTEHTFGNMETDSDEEFF